MSLGRRQPLPLSRGTSFAISCRVGGWAKAGGPMRSRILITGGAGFVGSHVADELLRCGCHVRVLDSLSSQVHGEGKRPPYLHSDVEVVRGDITDAEAVRTALDGI